MVDRDEWVRRYEKRITDTGIEASFAKLLSSHEIEEFDAGDCECLNESPEDVADEELEAMRASV